MNTTDRSACGHSLPDEACVCGCEYDMAFCGCGWLDCECPAVDTVAGAAGDDAVALAIEYLTEAVGTTEHGPSDAAATLVNVGDVRRVLRALAPAPAPGGEPDAGAAVERALDEVEALSAIKAAREQAAEERVAMHARGEPLTDYSAGVLDGLDKAWLAGRRGVRRPDDQRTVTSVEEWWACDDAYETGYAAALADVEQHLREHGHRGGALAIVRTLRAALAGTEKTR